ncbi:class I SAM-dependent methyltransferase [Criblamydia sequanensis]|uniref:Methyltransferase n=1 Tax=Candidatus Criblamydia sequanensis CRIB-18 TaxID=1437425 RepID=A0A090DW36_9BACT|nr:class I SAM-dependent methyltransferase [Criblamydia sequanensis]CDR33134.1 Methyltransferase [Criblamydia sequanensis CRIB-18]
MSSESQLKGFERQKRNKQTANYWSWVAKRKELGYWDIPGWKKHQNLLASRNPDQDWLDVCFSKISKSPPKTALSLGSGSGSLERILLERGYVQEVYGCDISPDLVQISQDEAKKLNLKAQYFVADLNDPVFNCPKVDLVIAAGILHHVEELERLFLEIKKILKEGGHFIVYDYVGPSRFQWRENQIKRCNEWIEKLPKNYLKKKGYPWYYTVSKIIFNSIPFSHSEKLPPFLSKWFGERVGAQVKRLQQASLTLNKVVPPPVEQFLVTDPSEAIRSEDILKLASQVFKIEELIPQGGTLAQPLFGRIVANFLKGEEGKVWASKILDDERLEIEKGNLESDLVAFIAKID